MSLNRKKIKKQQKQLRRINEGLPAVLQELPKEKWPVYVKISDKLIGIYRSRFYFVQKYQESAGVIRLSMCRAKLASNGDWEDGLTWDEIQSIKYQVGYGDCYAIEIYPRDIDVINVHNMRHIWVLPGPLDIGWFHKYGY